ncbi:MAG: AI-2E family transporter [Acidimicrobiia bacterium]|nr:AI-2E family transporter [Acidimicrobiia bacterium]
MPGEVPTATAYLGLDWFLLNLALLALIFAPLERLWPLRSQSVFRTGWTTDSVYFLVSHLLVQGMTLLTLLPATVIFAWAVNPGLQEFVRTLPFLVQCLACAVLADLVQYTVHRLFHQVRRLWPFHAVHHSSRNMDWLAGSRLHLVDVLVTRGLSFVPLFVLGFIVVYQQIENFLIAPKITAQTMELHAGVAFASAIVGGAVLGPTGAILGLPAAAVMQGFLSSVGHRYEVVDDTDLDAE